MEAYLDNSATTRCCEEAAQLVVKLLTEDYGNPSSLHNKGVIAENYMNDARKKIAKTLKVQEKEICFTSGGTESNNLAIIGVAEANKRSGKHVITTSIEHPSVSATMAYLEEHGYEVTYLPVDAYGVISLDDLKAAIGEKILDAFPDASVDVHNPEMTLSVEIRDKIYVYSETLPGPGGMPIGTNGKAMLLLSGGIDSPVAGYMIAKRGVKIEAVYFHAPPYTSERAKQKVVDLAKLVARYSGPIRLHVVNFTDIQLYIYDQCPHEELTIIMRRYMMRIAEHFARKDKCLGLITGESIGQVASQTLQSLAATDEVCELPVYRPVIGFDKEEIVQISRKINTFETSIQPFEDCCTIFVAKHPVTKPNLKVIHRSEEKLNEKIDQLMEEALASTEVIEIQ